MRRTKNYKQRRITQTQKLQRPNIIDYQEFRYRQQFKLKQALFTVNMKNKLPVKLVVAALIVESKTIIRMTFSQPIGSRLYGLYYMKKVAHYYYIQPMLPMKNILRLCSSESVMSNQVALMSNGIPPFFLLINYLFKQVYIS